MTFFTSFYQHFFQRWNANPPPTRRSQSTEEQASWEVESRDRQSYGRDRDAMERITKVRETYFLERRSVL